MKLYLIRHGQTRWNIEGKVQGKTDIELDETGLLQARKLERAMESHPVQAVFSSPLKRAWQTAGIIAAGRGVPLIPVPELKEVEFGLWEGKTWREISQEYPTDFQLWDQNPVSHTPTGGEARESCIERCRQGMQFILEQQAGDLAIVAHGGILVFVADYLLSRQKAKNEIVVKNASITTIEYDKDTGTGELVHLNDVSHLETS